MSWPPRTNSIDLSGMWEIRRDDDSRWRPALVPAAWQHILGVDFHGVAWYRRSISLPDEHRAARAAGRRFWLRFESVATDITMWANGIEVGRHIGDYVPFQFEITDALGDGDTIDLLFRVDEIHAPRPAKEGDLQRGHITKGFHDVISIQHAGIWQPVHLAHSGDALALPDGVAVRADPSTGGVDLEIEFEPLARAATRIEAELFDPSGERIGILPASIDRPRLWSPDDPALHRALVRIHDERGISESHDIRFAFREFRADGRLIVLNGRPLMVRGVLDWGHEPDHIAPAPTPDEVRARFDHLRRMGFNTVCLCMWYPPRHFYDIADEMGMFIWQEHPVWQSPMRDEDVEEYQRLFSAFVRRDRNHPSVAIVSATCEHPCFHPRIAEWWWQRAKAELPRTLLELQTAFFKWADLEKTDLYDEHTYDNANRWVSYIDDVRAHLDALPPKPFVMGETIAFSSWPDVGAIRATVGEKRPWWLPRAFDHMIELEAAWRERFGETVVQRFRRQSDRFHLIGRKFQVEQFRRPPDAWNAANAGLVMNHLRDVPACQCGFADDLDRWRFDPEAMRPWLGDGALLLRTPEHRRAFGASELAHLPCEIALSNFAGRDLDGEITITAVADDSRLDPRTVRLKCRQGEVRGAPFTLQLTAASTPRRITIEAAADGIDANHWDLWVFPDAPREAPDALAGVYRLDALPFEEADAAPDEVEKGYSRGYGIPVRNWVCALPDPARLAPDAAAWTGDGAAPSDMRVLLTHRLTRRLIDWLAAGGRVILFASKAPGGLGTSYEWMFGQAPLIIEDGPLAPGDSAWIVDLLGYDLVRRYCRAIPTEALGIAEHVDPLIRLVYTHDQKQRVRFFDMLFHTRIGEGMLMVSSLDHSEAPSRHLLAKMIHSMAVPAATPETAFALASGPHLEPGLLREFAFDRPR